MYFSSKNIMPTQNEVKYGYFNSINIMNIHNVFIAL